MADRSSGATTFGQMARFVELRHRQTPEGKCTVTVEVLVTLHALDTSGALGAELTGSGVTP